MANTDESRVVLAATGTTGTGRKIAAGFKHASLIAIELFYEVVGATPVFTFTVQGLKVGGDPSVATDWTDLGVVVPDSTVAATKTPSLAPTQGQTARGTFYLDGLDKRFFDQIAVNVATNTNVTYRINAYPNA